MFCAPCPIAAKLSARAAMPGVGLMIGANGILISPVVETVGAHAAIHIQPAATATSAAAAAPAAEHAHDAVQVAAVAASGPPAAGAQQIQIVVGRAQELRR